MLRARSYFSGKVLLIFCRCAGSFQCGGVYPHCRLGESLGTTPIFNGSREFERGSHLLLDIKDHSSRLILPREFKTLNYEWSLAINVYHDGTIAVGHKGQVQCVLEMERLFDRRYFFLQEGDDFRSMWLQGLRTVRDHCECEAGKCPTTFDIGLVFGYGYQGNNLWGRKLLHVPRLVELVFGVKNWHSPNHHEAHAYLGFYASPFRSALIVSYDGVGNDGVFEIFLGTGFKVHRIASIRPNLGSVYMYLAGLLPEVTGIQNLFEDMCGFVSSFDGLGDDVEIGWRTLVALEKREGFSGKLMGYAASGVPDERILDLILKYTEVYGSNSSDGRRRALSLGVFRAICESEKGQRTVAASIQAALERYAQPIIAKWLQHVISIQPVEGIVLSGGVALNVLLNQLIRDSLTRATSNVSKLQLQGKNMNALPLDVFVPPAPNDCGLVVGGLWSVSPQLSRQPLQYLGFKLWDLNLLEAVAMKRGAINISAHGGVEYVAKLLASGMDLPHTDNSSVVQQRKPIIAVVRGRQEFGPRALGHRSLLAVPDTHAMKERMNRLKVRQWWRPVAPMIADEALFEVFGSDQKSPYMAFAPKVRDEVQKRFPGLAHVDGTARHQSVGSSDDAWIHALLLAVGRRTGLAALINTSFNVKGKPIINRIADCLSLLDSEHELDYVLIEDWLFHKRTNQI